ncbi:TetR/AcrR family transcriptional regulator [Saccharopolyspora erythraea]|uniref:TetR/AcrR family transcriptional regulator n=1 Tax=Saccharopolyspora erythraea TaxID=1836 RepID=UPI001BAAC9FD|nr:TetR/AcrR family transcriptional regulator [Saccharopolyspora erythraea]QUH01968.1 TetR/AcrR family transcriptional regulator [Saccharopolyspora erythraea]
MSSSARQPAEPEAPRRTRRGIRTRDALVAAARKVVEKDGYLDARIVDIAAEAGVATGSFYTHFASKEEVFAAVLTELQDEMLHAGVGGSSRELRRGVEEANRAYLESYRRNAALMAAMEQAAAVDRRFLRLRQQRSQAFIERSAAAISRLQEAGLADPVLDPEVTARALNAMVSRMAYATFATEQPVPFETLVATLARLWMNALRMPEQ